MRIVTFVLILLLAMIQYPLWWGHGGWLRVHELQQQLANQTQKNADLKLRNERVQGEVADPQHGTAGVEMSSAPMGVVPNPVSRSKEERRAFERQATKEKDDAAKKKKSGG